MPLRIPRPSYPTAFNKGGLQRQLISAGMEGKQAGQIATALDNVFKKQAQDERLNYATIEKAVNGIVPGTGGGGGLEPPIIATGRFSCPATSVASMSSHNLTSAPYVWTQLSSAPFLGGFDVSNARCVISEEGLYVVTQRFNVANVGSTTVGQIVYDGPGSPSLNYGWAARATFPYTAWYGQVQSIQYFAAPKYLKPGYIINETNAPLNISHELYIEQLGRWPSAIVAT